jgi:hypothetical protein
MSITQRYWLVWAPGLILAGFFVGLPGLLALFVPSYTAYYGHRKEWSVGKFALVATGIAMALFFLATSRV